MKEQISLLMHRAIEDKIFPGCTVGWIKNGEKHIMAFGQHGYQKTTPHVTQDTLYDIASVTKTIPTSSILIKLIDDGVVQISDPVYLFIPEFDTSEDKRGVTLFHLLTYTLDMVLPGMSSMKEMSPDEIVKTVVEATLKYPPGTNYIYVGATSLLTTKVIERITGKGIDEVAQEMFFGPLGMNRTTFFPLKNFSLEEIAPTEFDEWRGKTLHGEVHDESSYVLGTTRPVGIAGLFSTTPDLLRFCEMLLQKGEIDKKRYFSEQMVREMMTDQVSQQDASSGFGWEMSDPRFMGAHASGHAVGKRGYTGCHVLIDPLKMSACVLLSNRVHPKRPENPDGINYVRSALSDLLLK